MGGFFLQSRCHRTVEVSNTVQMVVVVLWVRTGEQKAGIKDRCIKEKRSSDMPLKFFFSAFEVLRRIA